MYRSQYRQKVQAATAAQKKAAELRTKEAGKRQAAAKAQSAAQKTTSPTTKRSRLAEAERATSDANKYGKDAAEAEKKAARYSREAADLNEKIVKAERSAADQAERRRRRDEQQQKREAQQREAAERLREQQRRAAEVAAEASRWDVEQRLAVTEAKADHALRQLSTPRAEKLRVLMLGASPEGDLRVGREQARVKRAVQEALHRDLIDIDLRTAATTRDLLDGISRFRPHVVHFSGHSGDQIIGFEADEDDFNDGVIVSAEAFASACAATDTPPTLLVLNSCESASTADALVDRFAPMAIGMQGEVDDIDAITYAAALYTGIANGQSVESSHLLGKAAVQLNGGEHELPYLSAAADVDPKTVKLVKEPTEAA